MKTRDFLKRYAYVYLYVFSFFLLGAAGFRSAAEAAVSSQSLSQRPTVVIDAGHGGMDGGTTSCTGVSESQINLAISLRLDKLMALLGYDAVMVRTTDTSVNTEGDTIREQKLSDLKNRVTLVNGQSNALLVSIHQNHFPDGQYSGPQVFYAGDSTSAQLAQRLQLQLNQALAPNSKRECKQASGVYLMENIKCPGILVECGFLSNTQEEAKLRTAEYQKKLCCIIGAVLADYLEKTAAA